MTIQTIVFLWRRARPLFYGASFTLIMVLRWLKAFVLHMPVDFSLAAIGLDMALIVCVIELSLWSIERFYQQTTKRLAKARLHASRLQVLSDLGRVLAVENDEDALCRQVVSHVHEAIGCEHVRLYSVDEQRGIQRLRAFVGREPLDGQNTLHPGDRGYFQHFPIERWRYTPDISRITRTYFWLESGSEVLLPLRIQNRVAGFLMAGHVERNAFSEDDLELLGMTAHLTENTLLRLYHYRERERYIAELGSLQQTVTDIIAERELPVLLESILQRAIRLLRAMGGDLGVYEPETGETTVMASLGLQDDSVGRRLKAGEGAMGWVAQHHRSLLVRDYASWHNRSLQYEVQGGMQVLAAPLMTTGQLLGSIAVVRFDDDESFSEHDLRLLERFAQQAALAMENARLYQDAVRLAEKQRVLYAASQDIVASLSPEKVYAAMHRAIQQVMPAEAFVITLADPDKRMFRPVYVMDRGERFEPPPFPIDQGLSGEVWRTGQSVHIGSVNALEAKGAVPHFGFLDRVQSVLAVPIRLKGKILGVLSAQSYAPYAYSQDDAALLHTLAGHAAVVLENVRLFTQVRNMAIRDELTGVYNRRYLFRRATYELARAQRYARSLGLIMLDIDYFKRINDTYGHGIGDHVLQVVAHTCQHVLRKADILGRYGGEEFAILLPETDVETTRFVAERLCAYIRTHPVVTDSGPISVTISIGVTAFLSSDSSLRTLFQRVDQALYLAKNSGRNRVCQLLNNDSGVDERIE